MIVYLDSSCGVALIKDEQRTDAIRAYLDDLLDDGHIVLAGQIFETELQRVAIRLGLPVTQATNVIDSVVIVEHETVDFRRASGYQMAQLGSLDALHLATAERARADVMLTFDSRLADASETVGIPVLDVTRARTLH